MTVKLFRICAPLMLGLSPVLSTLPAAAAAGLTQSVEVLGESISYTLPEGYCPLEESAERERAFVTYMDKAVGSSLKILRIAVPCTDLSAFRRDPEAGYFQRYVAVAEVGLDRRMIKFRLGTTLYLKLLSSFKPTKLEKAERRANKRLNDFGDGVRDLKFSYLGDEYGFALYTGSAMLKRHELSDEMMVRATGGTSLSHSVPMAAFVYDSSGELDFKEMSNLIVPVLKSMFK